jgi:O-antigen/teichoic acid export membrane protein
VTSPIRDVLARNTFWYALITLVGLTAGLAMSVVLARGLGPALMGDFSFLVWTFRTLEAVAGLGFGIALVRYSADALARDEPYVARGVIGLLLRWQLVSVVIVVIGTVALTFALAPPDLKWPLVIGAIGLVPVAIESLFMRATYGAQRYDLTAQVSAIKTALLLGISIAAVMMGAGLTGIVLGQSLATVLSCALQARRALSLYPPEAPATSPALRQEVGRYVVSLSVVRVLETLVWERSEIFFLKLWVLPQEIAYYSLAAGLASRAMIVPAIFVGALLPALASLHGAGDDGEFGRVYRSALRSVALVGAPIAAVSAGLAPALITVLYGEAYGPVALLYRLLVGVSLLGVMRDVAWAALRAAGDRRSMLTATAVTAALDLGLAAILVRRYGTFGAVTANTVAQLTVSVWAFVAIRRLKGAGLPWGDLPRIAGAAMVALLATSVTAAAAHGVVSLVLGTAAGLVTYAVASVLVGALTAHDWTFLVASSRRVASFRARA